MAEYNFYGMVSRMKYIARWGLMRNNRTENLSEHALEVAMIAHGLGAVRNRLYGGRVDLGQLALCAIYHDASEIITGDLPTPVKYYSDEIRGAYKQVERIADERLLGMLPEELRHDFARYFEPFADPEVEQLVKAADKLSALAKCIEEEKSGNTEFGAAKAAQERDLRQMRLPEVDYFLEKLMPGYYRSLDEMEG
ncbi:5'-deoxynucleotidase [Bittarella massiliensis (ex Durand et al. 2017)]|uniref:5'-deoxynucleotidase n=1 Tax=Bittarella massiliensis (ex Durand et al. 2017) TaxID=1720313 RepID=UPI00073F7288|nr:5'-deoxynucleotidase [Bittarella massiliensis (ex Durand et al. 2017)]